MQRSMDSVCMLLFSLPVSLGMPLGLPEACCISDPKNQPEPVFPRLLDHAVLDSHYSECDLWTSSISSTGELVRNVDSQALPT